MQFYRLDSVQNIESASDFIGIYRIFTKFEESLKNKNLVKKEYNLSQIDEIAEAILAESEHKIIAFHGEMGVGKTTLIKVLAKQLGVNELTSSPTFSIVNEYHAPNDILYHFDCYRIENEEEAYDIGIEDYLYSDAWCFIEWPERIENLLPEDITKVTIDKINEKLRSIHLKN